MVWASLARAQEPMMLSGATHGRTGGTPPKETGMAPATQARPTLLKPPSEDTIIGLPLKHDGTRGLLTLDRAGSDLVLTKLTLTGEKISKPGEACTLDVSMAPPVVTRSVGRPVGANRFDVPAPLCPFSIDVLDGAALVSPAEPSCEIPAADCRITMTGLWGPAGAEISPQRADDLASAKVRLETLMRTNFHAALAHNARDRAAARDVAKEQAAFSADREMTCRDYDQESAIGFCATQITEARALALVSQFKPGDDANPVKPKIKIKVKPKKPKPAVALPLQAPPAIQAPPAAAVPPQ